MILRFFVLLFFPLLCSAVQAADLPGIPQFIDDMVAKHQFNKEELVQVFKQAEYRTDVITAITTPATVKPWVEYRASFLNPPRIDGGLAFWKQYATTLQRAEQQYGVPQEIILAVIGVETLYGRRTGRYRTLDALTTLAFDYPRRADFFRDGRSNFYFGTSGGFDQPYPGRQMFPIPSNGPDELIGHPEPRFLKEAHP